MPGRKPELTDKQRATIDAYFSNGFNKSAAMITGGYAETTANARPSVCFDNPKVVKEVERRRKRLAKKHELSQDWIIKKLMAFATAGETLAKFKKVQKDGTLMWDFSGATEDEIALVSDLGVEFIQVGRGEGSIQVKKFRIKEPDYLAALDKLARHLGFYNDKLEVTGSLTERIQAGRDRLHRDSIEDNSDDEAPTVH